MRRTNGINPKVVKLLNEIKSNAKSYNKHLTDNYLGRLSAMALLGQSHPLDRKDLAFKAFKLELINQQQYSINFGGK